MNKKNWNFKQNSQLKSLQKGTSVYATIRVTSSPKLRAKISKLMPCKKVAVGIHKQGTLGAKSYNS